MRISTPQKVEIIRNEVRHWHKKSDHTETSMLGRLVSCCSTGCLCGLHPEYARINKWGHGFATVEVKSDGDFQLKNLGVYEGKVF